MSNTKLLLSTAPLAASETNVTLDIFSEENLLRGEESPRKMLEGKLTFNPQGRIFFIPPQERTTSQPIMIPDRTKWDMYLIHIPFTLHEPPGKKYYEQIAFTVNLMTPESTAFDLFPNSITTKIEHTKAYTLSPQVKIQDVEFSLGQVGDQIRFEVLRPTITAFGEGEQIFYWVHKGFAEQPTVIPETKHALMVLQVPHGIRYLDGTVYSEVVIAQKRLGEWSTRDGNTESHPIHWDLQGAPVFFIAGADTSTNQPQKSEVSRTPTVSISQPKKSEVSQSPPHFDICVICALAEEANAFMQEAQRLCGVTFQQAYNPLTHDYYHTTLSNTKEEPLTMLVSWQPSYGPLEAGLHIKPILNQFRPHFAAMTGICAGDKTKVKLGDIIVAERAFTYDAGKIVIGKDGRGEHLLDTNPQSPAVDVLHYIHMFRAWQAAVANIHRPYSKHQQRDWLLNKLLEAATPRIDDIDTQELEKYAPDWRKIVRELQQAPMPFLTVDRIIIDKARVQNMRFDEEAPFPFTDPQQPKVHIKAVASGSTVRSDNPFSQIRIPVRDTVAIDMEGAAFYRTVAEFSGMCSLLVKGVSDYADSDKDDSYHKYAATVSAAYMLSFIREYVTGERIPELLQNR